MLCQSRASKKNVKLKFKKKKKKIANQIRAAELIQPAIQYVPALLQLLPFLCAICTR